MKCPHCHKDIYLEEDTPSTVYNADAFRQSKTLGNDGDVHWEWMIGHFGHGNMRPTDLDIGMDVNGNFLIIETKNPGVKVPQGQHILLKRLHGTGLFTIMILWGKKEPKEVEIWRPPDVALPHKFPKQEVEIPILQAFGRSWTAWSDEHPRKHKNGIPGFNYG